MNATDLMIGDWVMTGFDIAQVAAIDERGIYVDDPIYTCLVHVDFRFVKPILLTGEILEKNEFELKLRDEFEDGVYLINQDMCRYKIWILKNYDITVYFDKKGGKFSIEIDWNNIEHFMYVHELQHALRLCGIKKEIKL